MMQMMQMNMQNLIALMKLWETARVRKFILQKPLLKMKDTLTIHENKKPEICTLMRLWENALVEKIFLKKPV